MEALNITIFPDALPISPEPIDGHEEACRQRRYILDEALFFVGHYVRGRGLVLKDGFTSGDVIIFEGIRQYARTIARDYLGIEHRGANGILEIRADGKGDPIYIMPLAVGDDCIYGIQFSFSVDSTVQYPVELNLDGVNYMVTGCY